MCTCNNEEESRWWWVATGEFQHDQDLVWQYQVAATSWNITNSGLSRRNHTAVQLYSYTVTVRKYAELHLAAFQIKPETHIYGYTQTHEPTQSQTPENHHHYSGSEHRLPHPDSKWIPVTWRKTSSARHRTGEQLKYATLPRCSPARATPQPECRPDTSFEHRPKDKRM